ncbi:MAG: Uncharacterized protein G01um101470_1042, partial [Parcubacteria group bacterium Gr01-1014_70]
RKENYMLIQDTYSGPLEPSTLLPEQFTPSPAVLASPERRLMRAVLEDALNAYWKYKGMGSRKARRLFQEAMEWFRSTDGSYVFSFENICMAIDLDAQAVRERLFYHDSPSTKLKNRQTRGRNTQVT